MLERALSLIGLGIACSAATTPRPGSMHYSLHLRVDPIHQTIQNRVTVALPPAQAAQGRTFLLSRNYTVANLKSSANATGTIEDSDQPFPGLRRISIRTRPGASGPASFTIDYAGPLFQSEQPPVNAATPERLELSADSLWYPISTNFNARFTLDAAISGLPRGMALVSPDQISMSASVAHIHRTRPSQDIAFSGATGLKRKVIGNLTIAARDFSSPSTRVYLQNAPLAFAFLERWLGPVPTGKAAISIVNRANGTGYSRPGYLVIADTGKPFAQDDVWGRLGYVAHELSHGWWSSGDFTGEDYWLVESPAEYAALRFIEAEKGRAALAPILANKQARAAKAGPILGHGRPSGDAVYAKGPLLLIALEQEIGRGRLDALLARLARRQMLTTADFLEELRKSAGADVSRWFEKKLRS